jgi:hypothetical protein
MHSTTPRVLERGQGRFGCVAAPIQPDARRTGPSRNGEAPRYHAREVVRVRAKLEGARFVFGSATPSLETYSLFGAGPTDLPSSRPTALFRSAWA